ncbi:MAG TPA: amidohydrolase family protein [Casimicrobiaceae bacterium]|nr:amidohydrolase family protein [Casimicrobiaceae bacterium]
MKIDIHAHVFPPITREEAASADERAPWLLDQGGGRGQIMIGDKPFRPVQAMLWDAATRLRWMDATGIDVQFVCATPVMFGYAWKTERTTAWSSRMNDRVLEFCSSDPRRLKPLAQVPLQDVGAACREVTHARRSGHIGVQIGNHVEARGLDDPGICEFLGHCATEEMPVLVHPWDMMSDGRMKRWMLPWLVAMPAETQLTIVSLILSGAFERLPRSLALIFAHGGGSFAWLAGRVDNAWRHRDIVRVDCPNLPSSYCDRFYVDSAIFDPTALALLVERMGADRVMLGTDAPFPLGEQEPGTLVEQTYRDDPALRDGILAGNAQRVFRLAA